MYLTAKLSYRCLRNYERLSVVQEADAPPKSYEVEKEDDYIDDDSGEEHSAVS